MRRGEAVVLVVDDDPSVRKSLARLVQASGLKALTFASPKELLDHGAPEGPACIVLDVHLPGLNGLQLQQELAARSITTPIIFITGHGDIPMSVKAMKGGAMDFLTKPLKGEELLRAVEAAIKSDERLRAARTEKARIEACLESLTPREREVLALVVKGRMNKEIAAELGASEKTVKVHRGRVMHKMRVASVADLVRATELLKPRDPSSGGSTT